MAPLSLVPRAVCLDWPVFTEAFLGAPWPNWLAVGTLLRHKGVSPRCQWGCWPHAAMLGVLCFHSLPPAFLASGTGHMSPFVCAQDGTLRLWEYRSGYQLQCCDLASLQEPAEHQGHKVTPCSTLVLEPSTSYCSDCGKSSVRSIALLSVSDFVLKACDHLMESKLHLTSQGGLQAHMDMKECWHRALPMF